MPKKKDEKDPKMAVALLRVAVALKAKTNGDLDSVVKQTAKTLGLDEAPFRSYVTEHMGAVEGSQEEDRSSKEEEPAYAEVSNKKGTRSPVI